MINLDLLEEEKSVLTTSFGSHLCNYHRLALPAQESCARLNQTSAFHTSHLLPFLFLQKLPIREINGKSKCFLYPLLNPDPLRSPAPHCALLRFFVNTESIPDLLWLKGSLGLRSKAEFIDCYRSTCWVGVGGRANEAKAGDVTGLLPWRCAETLRFASPPSHPLGACPHCKIPGFAKLKG